MASLYKRASPPQARIMNAVEGAIKNVADAHGIVFDRRYARSVAKRAAGTLTAQWPDVLAAKDAPSGWVETETTSSLAQPSDVEVPIRLVSADCLKPIRRRPHSTRPPPSPLRKLEKLLYSQMRMLKEAGLDQRAEAFIYVLKHIAKLKDEQ